jgi:hypothetical protein
MARLSFSVSVEIADTIRNDAKTRRMSVSKYLATVVEREIRMNGWPERYFETVVGGWKGEPLERPSRGEFEAGHDL